MVMTDDTLHCLGLIHTWLTWIPSQSCCGTDVNDLVVHGRFLSVSDGTTVYPVLTKNYIEVDVIYEDQPAGAERKKNRMCPANSAFVG